MSPRRGYLLAEALCALALGGILAAAAAAALSGTRRTLLDAERRVNALRAGREALLSIGALARDAELLQLEGDTALALSVRTAASVVCARGARSITLPPMAVSVGTALTVRAQPIEAGDEVSMLVRDSTGTGGVWWRSVVDSVQSSAVAEPCGAAGGWLLPVDAGRARIRLVLLDPPPVTISEGAPVRVARAGRLAIYSAGGGEWMLGWRRCVDSPRRCGVVQPVAGPLRTPGSGGLRMRYEEEAGGLLIEVRVPGQPEILRSVVALRDAPR